MADRRDALIIATGAYDHDGLRDLQSPAADAQALATVLGDRDIGGFAVDVLRDRDAHEVRAHIEDFFADRHPGDVLLLHMSCHGLKSESGELFFTARDTKPRRLASTAIAADFIQRCLRLSRSRNIVVLLDCCYGGAFAAGVRVRSAGDVPVMDSFPPGRGRAVITAASAMEYAFEGDRLAENHAPGPSVFTSALVEGLETGKADLDGDGLISVDELYDYVYDRVREHNPAQTPTKDIEVQGDLYVARAGRRAPAPAHLPRQSPPDEAARKVSPKQPPPESVDDGVGPDAEVVVGESRPASPAPKPATSPPAAAPTSRRLEWGAIIVGGLSLLVGIVALLSLGLTVRLLGLQIGLFGILCLVRSRRGTAGGRIWLRVLGILALSNGLVGFLVTVNERLVAIPVLFLLVAGPAQVIVLYWTQRRVYYSGLIALLAAVLVEGSLQTPIFGAVVLGIYMVLDGLMLIWEAQPRRIR